MRSRLRWTDPVFAAAVLVSAAAPLRAEYVSDPGMCGRDPVETQEVGMRLDPTGMWALEYTCLWDVPLDFASTEVQIRPGYCSEPGLLFPTLFALLAQPGQVLVWEGDSGEPQVFTACD